MIRNTEQCRKEISMLRLLSEMVAEKNPEPDCAESIKGYMDTKKREIRAYLNRPVDESRRIVAQDWDWALVRIIIPAETMEEAEEWFESNEYIEYYDRGYDCTGQSFTSWYRIFEVGGKFVGYHRVSADV